MSHYLNHPEIYNHPIRLTEEEKKNPDKVLKQFCSDYSLHELRDHQWNQLEVCLATDNTPFDDPEERANFIYRHGQMERMFEALFLIFKIP